MTGDLSRAPRREDILRLAGNVGTDRAAGDKGGGRSMIEEEETDEASSPSGKPSCPSEV